MVSMRVSMIVLYSSSAGVSFEVDCAFLFDGDVVVVMDGVNTEVTRGGSIDRKFSVSWSCRI